MNKFSIRSIPAAVALTATLAFAAHAQVGVDVGVRTGVNSNIGNDVRANAGLGVSGSTSTGSVAARNETSAGASTSASGGVKGTVDRLANRTGNAIERGADATKRGGERALDAVGGVARRADRRIQNALPANTSGRSQTNVQGSATVQGAAAP